MHICFVSSMHEANDKRVHYKEAVARENTERPEAVDAGTVKLVGADVANVVAEASRLLDDQAAYQSMARATNPYGDGQAARRIVDILTEKRV